MEKDSSLRSQDIKKEQEKRNLLNRVVISFNSSYDQVLRGEKDKENLYAGDFIYGKPLEIILKQHPELVTVLFKELLNLFSITFQPDIRGPILSQIIRREPELKTEFLKEFVNEKPGQLFNIDRTYFNLRQDKKGKILLTYDRYIAPGSSDISASAIFNIRRLRNNL